MSEAHTERGYCNCGDCIARRILALDDHTLQHGGEDIRARYRLEAQRRIAALDAERAQLVGRLEWLDRTRSGS